HNYYKSGSSADVEVVRQRANGRRCPLWVKRVGFVMFALRPVCPQHQTFSGPAITSQLGQDRTPSPTGRSMIALVDNAESLLARHERHVVGHDRVGETLQDKRADLFSRNASFECHVDALTEQNLAVPGLAAEPCRYIAHGANRSVSGALGKSDQPQGCVTLGDANAKAQFATSLAPRRD